MLWSATEEGEEEEDEEEELGKMANVRQPKHRPGMGQRANIDRHSCPSNGSVI